MAPTRSQDGAGSSDWFLRLGLAERSKPEVFTSSAGIGNVPYAQEIALLLDDLGLSAVFCLNGVPTLGFLVDPTGVATNWTHAALWNQGLLGALLVISDDVVHVLSLDRRPQSGSSDQDARLVEILSLVTSGPSVRDILERVEAGTYWREHPSKFGPDERIDRVLLSNIIECQRRLSSELGGEIAQSLVLQTIFISYLEDRSIIGSGFFEKMSSHRRNSFGGILKSGDVEALYDVFVYLRGAFDGNVFSAPGVLDFDETEAPAITPYHLSILADFRFGDEEFHSGQGRLFGYNFKYIPIGLGTDRAKVLQFEVLKLPFSSPEEMPDRQRANYAGFQLARLVDQSIDTENVILPVPRFSSHEIDRWVYEYYSLDDRDVALINDTFDYIIPAMQPRSSGEAVQLWQPSTYEQRQEYAEELCRGLADWLKLPVQARLAAISSGNWRSSLEPRQSGTWLLYRRRLHRSKRIAQSLGREASRPTYRQLPACSGRSHCSRR